MTLTPLADWHIGMFSWSKETGENWDLKIARERLASAIDDLTERSPRSHLGVVWGGGDLLHADSNENKTAKNGNALKLTADTKKCF